MPTPPAGLMSTPPTPVFGAYPALPFQLPDGAMRNQMRRLVRSTAIPTVLAAAMVPSVTPVLTLLTTMLPLVPTVAVFSVDDVKVACEFATPTAPPAVHDVGVISK